MMENIKFGRDWQLAFAFKFFVIEFRFMIVILVVNQVIQTLNISFLAGQFLYNFSVCNSSLNGSDVFDGYENKWSAHRQTNVTYGKLHGK